MRILALYVAREFLKLLSFMVVGFVAIYTLFDFIEKVDNFTEAGLGASTMLSFFMLQVPEITSLLLPVAVLMATIITLGLMAARNEITAVKSSGVSIFRFTLPILLLSVALAFGLAVMNETVLPRTKARTNYIWDVMVEKKPNRLVSKKGFYLKGRNAIYRVGYYDPVTQSLSNVVYNHFDHDFNLDLRVDARRARYLGGKWVFFSGLYQKRLPGGGYDARRFKEITVPVGELPDDFTRLSKPSDEMSFAELAEYLRQVEGEGYDARRYRVDLQARISYPFVCLIMALLGIPLALMQEGGRSMAVGVILGLGFAMLYWVGFSYTRSIFGYSGVLPPVLAVWLPNLFFALIGGGLLTSIRQ